MLIYIKRKDIFTSKELLLEIYSTLREAKQFSSLFELKLFQEQSVERKCVLHYSVFHLCFSVKGSF